MRFDIIKKDLIPSSMLNDRIQQLTSYKLESILHGKTYWVHTDNNTPQSHEICKKLFCDHVDQSVLYDDLNIEDLDFNYCVEVSFKPGVTDNTARSSKMALIKKLQTNTLEVATGDIFFVKSQLDEDQILNVTKNSLANDLIQRVEIYNKKDIISEIPSPDFPKVKINHHKVETIDLNISDDDLLKLSKEKLWALSLDELNQIKNYYNDPNIQKERKEKKLPLRPNDIEMEILAQTWSEHCKHKIFAANIEYTEDSSIDHPIGKQKVEGVFKSFIKKATDELIKNHGVDWAISVFTDNAGIVRFDNKIDYCFKVETHNSPSALDPYGGALTGILGVNRDILGAGIGAKPIANTNVLCFAPSSYPKSILEQIPPKLKSPLSILQGVHRGIVDGGNKSGIPTVNGSINFHDNYVGKPLVYCGTVGAIPHTVNNHPSHLKRHRPGDYIVVCGGDVGADGIHGATFSSLELDDNAPSTAVQIGDPFTQKRLMDFLLEARDKNLYNSLTDNGAGGLSSSVGEMAEHTNGAYIDIAKVPLKYQGLSPYEIVISESQERMTFSVPPECLEEFTQLAHKRHCNPAIIGKFHNKGTFDILKEGKTLASLRLNFLHESLKPMKLKAHFTKSKEEKCWYEKDSKAPTADLKENILKVLSNPNIQSKEKYIRQYDHEVKGASVIKPLVKNMLSGPSDGAVLWTFPHGGSETGAICITNGLCPQVSHIDTYLMTQMSIDEAIRNQVACGANPEMICLCDNYCWPDPIESEKTPDGQYKLAQLVRSGQALYDTAIEYKTPFVSGKDSMKNDFIGETKEGKTTKISVPPTLLISALGKLDHLDDAMTSDFKKENDLVYYIGPDVFEKLYFSFYNQGIKELAPIDLKNNKKSYKLIHKLIKEKLIRSCHDVSDGGIITSIIESLIPRQLGFKLNPEVLTDNEKLEAFLFNEMTGGFIVSINSNKRVDFESKINGIKARHLGEINNSSKLDLNQYGTFEVHELTQAWSSL